MSFFVWLWHFLVYVWHLTYYCYILNQSFGWAEMSKYNPYNPGSLIIPHRDIRGTLKNLCLCWWISPHGISGSSEGNVHSDSCNFLLPVAAQHYCSHRCLELRKYKGSHHSFLLLVMLMWSVLYRGHLEWTSTLKTEN